MALKINRALWLVCGLMLFNTGTNAVAADESPAFQAQLACQTRLADLRWSYREWPGGETARPPRQAVIDDASIRARVERILKMRTALEQRYGIEITRTMLQEEGQRMIAHSKMPQRLAQMFEVLDNDPQKIASCILMPQLVERLMRDHYAWDAELHSGLKKEARLALAQRQHLPVNAGSLAQEHWLLIKPETATGALNSRAASLEKAFRQLVLNSHQFGIEWQRYAKLKQAYAERLKTAPSALRETRRGFVYEEVLDLQQDQIAVHAWVWPKRAFDDWWAEEAENWPADNATVAAVDLPVFSSQANADDSWRSGTERNAPVGRLGHTSVWTGNELIVWGGSGGELTDAGLEIDYLNDGGRYDPATDTWREISTSGAPVKRFGHSAVWTGTEMIIWGGANSEAPVDTTDPTIPEDAVFLANGGRYNPDLNKWTAVAENEAIAPRVLHSAVWTGSKMIIWGGFPVDWATSAGWMYNPANDSWTALSATNQPNERMGNTAVWTGSKMLVWGGMWFELALDPVTQELTFDLMFRDSGAAYDPVKDTWTPMATSGAPDGRVGHGAVWTGEEMIVWGGVSGEVDLSEGAEQPIVMTFLANGGIYNPANNQWRSMSSANAPSDRLGQTVVWSGKEMIVWGGAWGEWLGSAENPQDSVLPSFYNDGSRYDPAANAWTPMTTANAPSGRIGHTAVWTGKSMLIWGGAGDETWNSLSGAAAQLDNKVGIYSSEPSYTVSLEVSSFGQVSPNTPQSVDPGATLSFTLTPDAGFAVESASGCGGNLSGNVYTTGPVNANCTVTVWFAPAASSCHSDQGILNGLLYGNGSVSGEQAATRLQTNGAITIEPGAMVVFESGGSILLGEGFHAKEGSQFITRIRPISCN